MDRVDTCNRFYSPLNDLFSLSRVSSLAFRKQLMYFEINLLTGVELSGKERDDHAWLDVITECVKLKINLLVFSLY